MSTGSIPPEPPKKGFTTTYLTKLPALEKPYEITDPGCKGLRIKATPSGGKMFKMTVFIEGKRRIMTLGHFPDTSLSDARVDLLARKADNKKGKLVTDKERKAKEAKQKLERDRKEKANNITISEVMAEFVEMVVTKRRSIKSTVSMINVHILGKGKEKPCIVLGDMPIKAITKQNIKELVFDIRETRPGVFIEVFVLLRHFFEWSVRQEYINYAPISAGDKKDWKLVKQPKIDFALDIDDRGRVVTTLPEITRLFEVLDNEHSRRVGHCLKLLLLTGVRTGELLKAKKEHIDFKVKEWFIPKENTKSWRPEKNVDTGWIVPLTDYTCTLFKQLMETSDNGKVVNIGQPTLPWACRYIVKNHNFKRFTPHSLRKTLRSHIAGWASFEVCEKCLSHSLGQIAAIYDHGSMLEERRKALQIWSDKVYRACYGSDSNIVLLRG